ncbi:GNAT family N-acetyltransferase [Demequina subtropica]|uniref:GNAT family N-acetyltransferase n=1 Tax=Demequina subtropica TaxID=1638989 RepID=UPI0007823143|nr:GNAT family N-acetyltransferase [Demequina subtropica]
MTDSLLRRAQHSLAPLQRRDVDAAIELAAADAVAHVVPLMHLEAARDSGVMPGSLWGVRRRSGLHSSLVGVVWNGANLCAVLPSGDPEEDDALRAEVAAGTIARLTRPAALVGPADVTRDLWGRVEPWWGPAREVRARQVSMAIAGEPTRVEGVAAGDLELEDVRESTLDDYDVLLPACVHMFIGEVGYDPLQHGRAGYEERLRYLIRAGRSFVQLGTVNGSRQVVFKAEVGALGGGIAQVQGVWVHPAVRGRGLARAGMVAAVDLVRERLAPTVSLYVNDFNPVAIRTYDAVGFARVGTFATVMF